MKKTALMELNEYLTESRDYVSDIPGKYYDGQKDAIDNTLEKVAELMALEREQIEDAFGEGFKDGAAPRPMEVYNTGKQYHEQTYEQTKDNPGT